MWDTVNTKPAAPAQSTETRKYSTLNPKIAAKMKHFQKDLAMPVYKAGGTPDKILFGITAVGVAIGFFETLRFLYQKSLVR